ncbi:MAG: hypothetical protein KJO12_08375 [Ignavibacteria bacterium]|nr:hypothetical protein [Ignavibacteria bacterium]
MVKQRLLFSFILSIFLLSSISFSQSYLTQNFNDALRLSESGIITDARALSMGNAHTALSDVYSATLLNPATLGLARKFTISTSVGLNLYRNKAFFLDDSTESDKTETNLNQFGLVIPLVSDTSDNNLVISLGYNQSKDFNRSLKFSGFNTGSNSLVSDLTSLNNEIPRQLLLSYPVMDTSGGYLGDETILRGNLAQSGFILNEGGINHWSFGIAYEFAHNIFFGASINYNVGAYLSDRQYVEEDVNKFYPDSVRTIAADPLTAGFNKFQLNDIVEWTFGGYDIRFGVLYKFFDFISLGGSVKTPTHFTVEEKHFFNGKSEFQSGFIAEIDSTMESKFSIASPYEFTFGASVNLWIITGSAEVNFIDYTQMKFTDGLDVPKRTEINRNITETFTQIFNLRGGAEFRLPFTGLSVRAGFMYYPSPIAKDPADFDKKFLTAGLGIRSGEGAMEFNVTYVLGWWDIQSEDYGINIPAVYEEVRSDNIMASLTLRLD